MTAAAAGHGVAPKQGTNEGGGDTDVWGPQHSAGSAGQTILKWIQNLN
jgi:hypothetical protein